MVQSETVEGRQHKAMRDKVISRPGTRSRLWHAFLCITVPVMGEWEISGILDTVPGWDERT